jgi:hypothetical protein
LKLVTYFRPTSIGTCEDSRMPSKHAFILARAA